MTDIEQNNKIVEDGLLALDKINEAITGIQHQIHILQRNSREIHLTLLRLRVDE